MCHKWEELKKRLQGWNGHPVEAKAEVLAFIATRCGARVVIAQQGAICSPLRQLDMRVPV
jgi:hypothetical protein